VTSEELRLEEARARRAHWQRWGPYLAERAWGTVREDYSAKGTTWEFLPHDHARSRAYRWNEDGIAGICDRHQYICFSVAMWNGRDPILKERLFGLNGNEGNHGEDVKEQYFYVDSTPAHSYMKLVSKGSLCGLSRPPGFEEEPDAAFRFVDPILQQACGGDILLFVAKVMDFTHAGKHGPIVFTQFCEHIEGIDIVRVVIAETLQAGNVPDRSNRGAADLAHALGDVVGHRKDLAGLVIEQEVIVAKMRSAHMPMKVLGLHIETKYIGQQRIEAAGDILDCFGAESAGRCQRNPAAFSKFVLCGWHVKAFLRISQ
jgi:hypothetical protein